MKEAGRFIAAFTVKMSKNSWQLAEVLSTRRLFPSRADCSHMRSSATSRLVTFFPPGKTLWLTASVYLVSVRQWQEIASKAAVFFFSPFPGASSRLGAEKTPRHKREKRRPELSDKTQRTWKAIFKSYLYPSAVWSAEIKVAYGCHRDASHSGRLTTTRGICAFPKSVCASRSHPHTADSGRSGRDNLKLPLFKDL